MQVAVLGLGEAGSIYAADLARLGLSVAAVDPLVATAPAGVRSEDDVATAVRGAALVLSLVGGRAAGSVLDAALPAMEQGAIFADMNTASPADKLLLAKRAATHGIAFVDVAILAPVPRSGARTPLAMSGPGAAQLQSILAGLQIPASTVGEEAGAAAGLKLLRSVFMKGLAAAVLESVTAARAAGAEEWIIDQIASELGPEGKRAVSRILEGTSMHAARREAEMHDARSFLETLGVAHPITDGAIEWLHSLSRPDPG
jgi:3-hydroxyisobutyrate dehydrogenase-like beta-hydroxyacid dehydrogenase